jgi:crossover junction endodeoxyribonuclease RuvC
MFRFGETYGATQMAVAAHGMVMQYVPPTTWKKHFKLSRDKGVSRGLATQRFPDCADLFKRVKDDGRAEAALIALYGLETLCSVKFWQKERAE